MAAAGPEVVIGGGLKPSRTQQSTDNMDSIPHLYVYAQS